MTNPNASDYRDIGDTSVGVFEHEFRRLGSPWIGRERAIHAVLSPMSALGLAMGTVENRWGSTGYYIKPSDNNPFSLRPWTSDPTGQRVPIIDTRTGKQMTDSRGRGLTAIAAPGATAILRTPDTGDFLRFGTLDAGLLEWKRRLTDPGYKNGNYVGLKTVHDMIEHPIRGYAPPGDVHGGTGVDNADIGYADTVLRLLRSYVTMEGPDNGKEPPMAEPDVYVLSMGHRNHDGGGARGEYGWTPRATRELAKEIRRRGGVALIIQEERGSGEYYNGGLQAAARACVDLARTKGPFKAYISMHYNGGGSPGFHAIYPNGANDTKDINPLDVRLCEVMAKHVKKTNTVSLIAWTGHAPGVMDEKETGVGAKGYRLGEFVGTLGFRDTTARVIVEAGSIDTWESKYITDPNWYGKTYPRALCDALEEVFGPMGTGEPPKDEPVPLPEPPVYATPDPIEELESLPSYYKLGNGAQMVYLNSGYTVRAIRKTPRLRHAHPNSPSIGEDIAEGLVFEVSYLIINPDGSLYYYTPWNTRVRFEDVERVVSDLD